MLKTLEVKNLQVSIKAESENNLTSKDKKKIQDKIIIKNINFELTQGKITVIMGPNGSGKSTLANALMGHPIYTTTGIATLDGVSLLNKEVDERSKLGLFLSFQYPAEIEGITVTNFLRQAINSHREKNIRISEFKKLLLQNMKLLNIKQEFATRYLNKGFSGGEKKKMEILQLLMLQPHVAILDETDSGLDIDALREVCAGIKAVQKKNPTMSILVITHYQRILEYLNPEKVLILQNGEIVKTGTYDLVQEIEDKGYEQYVKIPEGHEKT